jgi:hypothetical protein
MAIRKYGFGEVLGVESGQQRHAVNGRQLELPLYPRDGHAEHDSAEDDIEEQTEQD